MPFNPGVFVTFNIVFDTIEVWLYDIVSSKQVELILSVGETNVSPIRTKPNKLFLLTPAQL